MVKIISISLLFLLSTSFGQSLEIWYGDRLYYNYNGNLIEIKEVKRCSSFYGYGIIDSLNIFMAYDPEDSPEPSTIIAVYDVQRGVENSLGYLYGTGDSHFSYNKDNDCVIYNLSDGIYMFKMHDQKGRLITDMGKNTKKILACENPYNVFWIDKITAGYYVWENNKDILKTLKIKGD